MWNYAEFVWSALQKGKLQVRLQKSVLTLFSEGLSLSQKVLTTWSKYLQDHNKTVPPPPEKPDAPVASTTTPPSSSNPNPGQPPRPEWKNPNIDAVVCAASPWIELYGMCSVGKMQYALGNFSAAVETLNQVCKVNGFSIFSDF